MNKIWYSTYYSPCATSSGTLGLALSFLGFFALHLLDMMPRVDCCGCSCRTKTSAGAYDRMDAADSKIAQALANQVFITEAPKQEKIDTSIV